MLAATEVAAQFGLVLAAVTALVGSVLKFLERNLGAGLAYVAVALLAVVAAVDKL
jgi:hypothetical protein